MPLPDAKTRSKVLQLQLGGQDQHGTGREGTVNYRSLYNVISCKFPRFSKLCIFIVGGAVRPNRTVRASSLYVISMLYTHVYPHMYIHTCTSTHGI